MSTLAIGYIYNRVVPACVVKARTSSSTRDERMERERKFQKATGK